MSFLTKKTLFTIVDLKNQILSRRPSFFHESQTSTVIPYSKIEESLKTPLDWCDLSPMPKVMTLDGDVLHIEGAVTWKEAREYLSTHGLTIMTAPTEELATILGGVATSATGERCFHFGNLRSQVQKLTFMDFKGEIQTLESQMPFSSLPLLSPQQEEQYAKSFAPFRDFKNAPFPRFEKQTDLMIGSEGQLGVILSANLKVTQIDATQFLLVKLPHFLHDINPHLEIFFAINNFRDDIIIAELIDEKGFELLASEDRPFPSGDALFLEIKSSSFDHLYHELLTKLKTIHEDDIFEITRHRFNTLRTSVPRHLWEDNQKKGVMKLGTDVQVAPQHFEKLLEYYQDLAKENINYTLFGHFGDAHLHFNLRPQAAEYQRGLALFEAFYQRLAPLQASPFAEHGLGTLKLKYIDAFWSEAQYDVFRELKEKLDPHRQFFPQGYMNKTSN